ncbi:MAG: autotransporter-associated beta strand repeat-containing protein [Verrucomicrobia bacterium]|nr:autotransporter-associated beta strand repeat-containing protein [Verrucomicrobiota bacterium]
MKTSSFTSARRVLLAAFASLAAVSAAHAVTYYWDANNTTAGFGTSANGTWDADGLWSTTIDGTGTVANTTILATDDVNFGTASAGFSTASIVSVSGAQSVRNITIGSANTNTVTISGGTSLTLGSGSLITNNDAAALTIATNLLGSSGFTKAGTGTLVLTGDNSGLSGGIKISHGALSVSNATALNGTGAITLGDTVGNRAQLYLDNLTGTLTNHINIGPGTSTTSSGSIQVGGGTANLAGDITITAGTTGGGHLQGGGGTLVLLGKITYTGGTVSQRGGAVVYHGGSGSSYSALSVSSSGGTFSSATLGATNGLATNGSVDLGNGQGTANFDLAGFNQSLVGVSSFVGAASTNLNIGNSSTTSDSTLTLTGSTSLAYEGVIRDTLGSGTRKVALVIAGANQTLSGTSTFTGGTTISSGTLTLGNATNTLANTGAVTVSGGTLALGTNSDTVGAVTVSGGAISSSTGVLTGSSYALQSGTVSAILGGSGVATKTTGGTVTLSGVNTYFGGTIVSAGTLATSTTGNFGTGNVTVQNGALLTLGNSSSIANGATLFFNSGSTAASINFNFVGSESLFTIQDSVSSTFVTAGTYTATELNARFLTSVFTGGGTVTVSAIPEPSTYAALAGMFGLALAAVRRRKRA